MNYKELLLTTGYTSNLDSPQRSKQRQRQRQKRQRQQQPKASTESQDLCIKIERRVELKNGKLVEEFSLARCCLECMRSRKEEGGGEVIVWISQATGKGFSDSIV